MTESEIKAIVTETTKSMLKRKRFDKYKELVAVIDAMQDADEEIRSKYEASIVALYELCKAIASIQKNRKKMKDLPFHNYWTKNLLHWSEGKNSYVTKERKNKVEGGRWIGHEVIETPVDYDTIELEKMLQTLLLVLELPSSITVCG